MTKHTIAFAIALLAAPAADATIVVAPRVHVSNSIQTVAANWRRFRQSPAAAMRQAPVTERPVALPPENQGAMRDATAIPTTTAAVR